jgi:hypothetical protein
MLPCIKTHEVSPKKRITCLTVILPGTVILTGTIDVEPQFIKYDDSDSESKNVIYLLCDVSRC